MLVGALAGTVIGGALIDTSAAGLFLVWALLLPLLALPTLAWQRTTPPRGRAAAPAAPQGSAVKQLLEVLHRDGARQVLVAQVLWVASYTALTPFMVLYAEEVLGLRAASAGLLLAGFGLVTGAGMVWGGRLPADRLRRTLLVGVALLGGGLLTAMAASNVAQAALPFASAALGAGLVSAVGFPYFSRFVPDGEEGRYAGAFFSARAIATTAALPTAGLLIAATGSYRALLGMGAVGLAALVPLARAERRGAPVPRPPAGLPAVERLAAVIPVYRSDRAADVAAGALLHARAVVLVDDGAPAGVAAELELVARDDRVRLVRMGANRGKGTAVAAGVEVALAGGADAVIVLDADGQHPPELIPGFLAAAEHGEVVIGDRPRDEIMPPLRRLANAVSTWALSLAVRRRLRDSQNGMRLFRASALRDVPPPDGRYEAETRHLKALIRSGREIGWVPMPAVYAGEASSFRTVVDTLRIVRAVFAPAAAAPASTVRGVLAEWLPRIGLAMVLAWSVAAALPLLQGLDEQLFLAVNGLGDGPEWLYQTFDPHSRNYLLLAAVASLAVLFGSRSLRFAAGATLAMLLAGVFSDMVMQVVQLAIDRPRPEEALGAEVLRSHGRHWSHIPSFPSGHLVVTTALVATAAAIAPSLRPVLIVYFAAVAVTRVSFGAHFPLDVVVGTVIGYQAGRFSAALTRAAGLLPARADVAREHVPAGLAPA
jgi:membrane-associated phospholipid phosphatase